MSAPWVARLFGLAREDPSLAPLSMSSRRRLLEVTHSRLVFSVNAIVFVGIPFVAWLYLLGQDIRLLSAWLATYVLGAVAMRLQRRQYQRERESSTDAQMVAKWTPIVQRVALAHGFFLALSVAITAGHTPFEYSLLLQLSIGAILAANAAHQTPVLGAFERFLLSCWGTCIVLLPWSIPGHWYFIMPLSTLYLIALYRYGLVAHRFFVQQARLEEQSQQLAERYRMAKEEAEEALAAKNKFLTTASHDLRQPVHAMGFLIESIAHRNRDPALVPALQDLRHSLNSVQVMFNSLLDLSKIEGGAIGVRQGAVALDALMQDVETLYREEARSRGLSLRLHLTHGRGMVLADASLLQQSLVNLVHNALRYTQHGGVLIGARARGNHWLLEVWDTGMGIANEERPNLYSPFYRHTYAWQLDSAGHGLGLAVVARCADLMGITHDFCSIEGRGSRFWLRLPRLSPQDAEITTALKRSSPLTPRFDALSGTCLVVDDDPQVASAWCDLMQAWGVDARCASSGAKALDLLDQGFRPQAIFCDQRLRSGESGFDVLRELLRRCPEASGAMVSGEFASEELQQAEHEGYIVLHKPVEVTQLHALLEQWLMTPAPLPPSVAPPSQ